MNSADAVCQDVDCFSSTYLLLGVEEDEIGRHEPRDGSMWASRPVPSLDLLDFEYEVRLEDLRDVQLLLLTVL